MGRKKYFAALAAAGMIGAMAVGSAFNSYAADGWTKSNDHWTYIYQGKTYTGWLETSEGKYYMDLSDGHMMTGWIQVDNKIYYMNPSNGGKMTAGTSLEISGTTYNFDASGACQNASGVSAQTPASSTSSSGGVTGENGGPGVKKNSASSNGPSGSNPANPSGTTSSSDTLVAGRTDGPG